MQEIVNLINIIKELNSPLFIAIIFAFLLYFASKIAYKNMELESEKKLGKKVDKEANAENFKELQDKLHELEVVVASIKKK